MKAELLAGHEEHERVGLAKIVGLFPGRRFEHGNHRPSARTRPVVGGAPGVRIGADENRSLFDQAYCFFGHFEIDRASFPDDDEVRTNRVERDALFLECEEQATLTDDVGAALGTLADEEIRRAMGRGVEMFPGNLQSKVIQLGGQVLGGPLGVVGEKQERDIVGLQAANKPVRSGNELRAVINHAVHVDEITFHWRLGKCLELGKPSRTRPWSRTGGMVAGMAVLRRRCLLRWPGISEVIA